MKAKEIISNVEVAVLGGGITGSATFYILSKYTDINSIVLVEKCKDLGQINSKESNNSQTLHFGDIEANYSPEKAVSTKQASQMIVNFLEKNDAKGTYKKSHKMLLAVGKKEIEIFEKRFEQFKTIFPEFKKIGRAEIGKIEPEIVRGRNKRQQIMAGYSENGYTVDFGKLAQIFASEAVKAKPESSKIILGSEVLEISKKDSAYEIKTNAGIIIAKSVIVAMCSHSLFFAKSLGHGKEFSILPVGGNFYTSKRKVLNAKVYTMQSDKLPFAGVHGDPNIHNENETRFGPTANFMPFLERNNPKTFIDFTRSSLCDFKSFIALAKVITDKLLFAYLAKSLIYELPYFGPRTYAKLCQKIIPTLSYEDFRGQKSKAGIRPQLINNNTGKLQMGEIEIMGENILFNITPSPGATACLKNAKESVKKTIDFFNGKYSFDEKLFESELSS